MLACAPHGDASSHYDLNLLLDPRADEERRAKILADLETMIGARASSSARHDWGVRPTAYEVRKRAEADYHLLQFHGPPELLEPLDHALKITDGVPCASGSSS